MEKIITNNFYHIYNRGINSSIIFETENNMAYFLSLVKKHLSSSVNILCYCLLNNHFHFVVEIKDEKASQAFSNLFNAYTKAFNKQNSRTGTLFERPFKRKLIKDEKYLKNLILYIHKNPETHHLVENFEDYKFSSFKSFKRIEKGLIQIKKEYVISLFENLTNFIETHQHKTNKDLSGFENLTGKIK